MIARRLALAALLFACACAPRAEETNGDDMASPAARQSDLQRMKYDSMVPPVEPRERVLDDAEADGPVITTAIGVRVDDGVRYVLARTRLDDRDLQVVADASGQVPVFGDVTSARAYAHRYFPVQPDGDPSSARSLAAAFEAEASRIPPLVIDLGGPKAWANDPASGASRPVDVVRAWELLEAADAAPPAVPFDPMGMYGLTENHRRGDLPDAQYAYLMMSMKIQGLVTQAERKGEAEVLGWPADTLLWSPSDAGLLAAVMRRSITDFTSRLSAEAATRDVTIGWRRGAP